MSRRLVIVNADDFGLSAGVNRGIVECVECGSVTSASLMVCGAAAREAAAFARAHPASSVGLHVDLGEWRYCRGTWDTVYQRAALDDRRAVSVEVASQLDTFRQLLGREPTHIDFHQHVHEREPVRSIAVETAAALGVPLRHHTSGIRYCGSFYGQTAEGEPRHDLITADAFARIVHALEADVTELTCHPGYADDLPTMYRLERRLEVETLCSPAARVALAAAGVALCSFADAGPTARQGAMP